MTFDLILYMDIISINHCQFVTTITSDLQYRTAHYIQTSKFNKIAKSLKEVFKIYKDSPLH